LRDRNKIYVLTENLNFFYRLNKELNRFKIPFKILSLSKKIPPFPSIILTTLEEFRNQEYHRKNGNFLTYSSEESFEEYILKVISTYRIGYKDHYSELTFSIDPGNRSGLIVFLDDYYLMSHCCFEIRDLIKKIKNYTQYFKKDNPDSLKLVLKFGKGVLSLTRDLVDIISAIFSAEKDIKILLIDEFKSSKIKINKKYKERKISKDEVSALVLALRDGIEVNKSNYHLLFNHVKSKSSKNEDFKKEKLNNNSISLEEIADIAAQVLRGNLSLSEASQMTKEIKILNLKDKN
jgi:hypothetical protein